MKKIRVLHIVPKLNIGGIDSMLYNYYLEMSNYPIHWDFVVHGDDIGYIEEKLIELGSSVYHVPPKSKNLFNYLKMLKNIMKNGNYDIVHAHQNNLCFIPLYIAKKSHIKIRIAHSHTCLIKSKNRSLRDRFFIILNNYYSTNLAYCGIDAGKWAFGNNMQGKWIINGLDINQYKFKEDWRKQFREKYAIDNDTIVLGMICRLSPEKNIEFSLSVLNYLKNNSKLCKYKLVIIGDGEHRTKIEREINNLDLSNDIFLLGRKNNAHKYYSFFDIFLLPSYFEGSPVSLIEAQCSNIFSVVSDTISTETFITNTIISNSITEGNSIKKWAKTIESFQSNDRTFNKKMDIFNIKTLANDLYEYYHTLLDS